MEQNVIYGLETKVKSPSWLGMSSKTAEQKCPRGKVHRAMAFNKVGSASKFPWQGDTAHQLNHLGVNKQWSYPECQTSILQIKTGPSLSGPELKILQFA